MNQCFTNLLVCPICKGHLIWDSLNKELYCRSDMKAYPVVDGIPSMIPDDARNLTAQEIEEKDKRCDQNRA